MRELTYYVATSVDGFIAGTDGDTTAFASAGDHIEWICQDYPDTLPDVALAALGVTADGSRFDTTLMGWHTYAAGFEHTRDPYPHTRQIVFSRTRTAADAGGDVEVTAETPVDVVRELKGEKGSGIWLCGGGALAAQLVGEIDRLVLKVNPVAMGAGVPLFGDSAAGPRGLHLDEVRQFDSGVVVLDYTRQEA
ncbi:dihydrofolate reductase family protein [Nocardioides currus]|uniref:Riboflavin biosynthesis protein RibD n=1 Tax=Nocardioides currus TaxID=2133958 RepID=A0A2R7YUW3_9ACTN|nr:dihydrofolate reductase family protein [Nocardioides currus]PUA80121.1 riboflavin biosynthesis protein RibD [Nocardioides currus]